MPEAAPDIPVCPKCGWYVHTPLRATECNPKLGQIADELGKKAEALDVASTKLGYGHGQFVLEVDRRTHLRVQPRPDGRYSVEDIFILDNLDADNVLAIVAAMKMARDGTKPTSMRVAFNVGYMLGSQPASKAQQSQRHLTYVEPILESIRRGGGCRQAICMCGWHGPERVSMELAADDAITHEKEHS